MVLGGRVVDVDFRHATCACVLLDEPGRDDASLLRGQILEIATGDVNVREPHAGVVVGDIDGHVRQGGLVGEYGGQYVLENEMAVLDSLIALVQDFLGSLLSCGIHNLVLSALKAMNFSMWLTQLLA